MKKFKKWLHSKGGIITICTTIALVVIALICIMVGYVYQTLNGDWSLLWEKFTNRFAITVYILLGVGAIFGIYIYFLVKRHKEIK